MDHTMEIRFRHKNDHSGGVEAVVRQGDEGAASYRITEWSDGTYSVSVQYHGKWIGLHTEYFGDIAERLTAQQVRDLLVERLGESALEIPTYLRRQPAFAA